MVTHRAPSGAPDCRPVPWEIRVRHLILNELHKATDCLIVRARACSRNNGPAGTEEAERRYGLVWDELDRRDARRAARERRRDERIRREADAWYAARAAESRQ